MPDYKTIEKPRILVVAMSGIGNLLMQTPLIKRLKEENSSAEISVMVAPRGTSDILNGNKIINKIFLGSPKPSFSNRIGMFQAVQKEKFDIGIVAFPGQLTTSSSLLYFGSVPMRIGHSYDYHFLKNTGLFLTNKIIPQQTHDVQQNLNLLQPLGIRTSSTDTEYDFPLANKDYEVAQNFLNSHGMLNDEIIGIHPGTNSDMTYKRWPVERWAQLADQLADQFKAKILIFGNENENHIKIAISKQMRNKPFDVTLSLSETAALISRCRCFISNDSGLMHVAVSQKIPTFGLFGPTNEGRTAPWGKFGHVIRAKGTKPTYDVSKLREIKKLQKADETLLALDVETVLGEIIGKIPNPNGQIPTKP